MGLTYLSKRLFFLLRPYKLEVALLIASLILDVGLDNGIRLSFKYLIDYALEPRDESLLVIILLAFAGAFVLRTGAAVGRDFLYSRLSNGALRDIRIQVFRKLMNLPIGYFQRNRTGDISARFSTDLDSVENALLFAMPTVIFSVVGILISLILIFLLEWHLAFIALFGLPVSVLLPRILEKRTILASRDLKEAQGKIISTVHENILGQSLIKAFSLTKAKTQSFEEDARSIYRIGFRANLLSFLMLRFSNIGVFLMQLAMLGLGAFLVFENGLSIGSLVSINILFLGLSQMVEELAQTIPMFVQARAGLARIDEIVNEPGQDVSSGNTLALDQISEGIVFENVGFSYSPDQKCLERVNLTIPYGFSAAFVGASGSGKSTILNLIMRFYDPTSGKVKLGERDLREVSIDSLRSGISVVLQDSFMFNASVRDNIAVGKPDATDAEIQAAAKVAEIHDFILSLPKGYATIVGERGGSLSGGQRQRLAIARAVIRNPKILILDEPTSALDPTSEAAIILALNRLGRGRTSITVTHRLVSAMNSDRIFVLDKGQIVESGSHRDLLESRGLYQSMWEKQNGFIYSADGGRVDVTVDRLRQIPLFRELSGEVLNEIKQLFVSERYNENQVIIEEGEIGDRFYIIARGTVEVIKGSEGQRIATLQDGDYFGEVALLKEVPRTASVRTRTPAMLLSLGRRQFHYLLSKVPDVRKHLEQALEGR